MRYNRSEEIEDSCFQRLKQKKNFPQEKKCRFLCFRLSARKRDPQFDVESENERKPIEPSFFNFFNFRNFLDFIELSRFGSDKMEITSR